MTSKREQTKQKIQQAAYQCVARYGFEKTTLEDIAREVGLNKASLYYYYKNKEDLFLEVTTNATRHFVETLQASTPARGGIEQQVGHYFYERSVYFLRMVEEVYITEETLRQVEPLFKDLMQEVEAQETAFVKGLLDAAIARGELHPVDTGRLAEHLLLFSEAIKHRAKVRAPNPRDREAIAGQIRENLEFMLTLLFKALAS